MTEMDTYYELRLYKDDKWGKGKAMHPRLMAAWDRFSKADTGLHDTLDGITSFELADVTGVVEGAAVEYRVELRVWFTLLERMHG